MAVLAGIDFFTVEVLTWGGLVTYYVLFFLHLESRRVSLAGITRHPDQAWMQQMARNATGETWGLLDQRRYVLHDRDTKFCSLFRATPEGWGHKTDSTPRTKSQPECVRRGGFDRQRKNAYRNWFCLVNPRCDVPFPTSLTIIMRRGTTKGKATRSYSRPRESPGTGRAAESAVGSGSVDY